MKQENWNNIEFQFKSRNGNKYTFTSAENGDLVVTYDTEDDTITFVYEKGGADGSTTYSPDKHLMPDLIGKQYEGKSGSYTMIIYFGEEEGTADVVFGNSSRRTSTYVISDDGKTITMTSSVGASSPAVFDLTIQEDGTLLVGEFSISYFLSMSASNFEGTVLTLVNA